MKAFYHVFLINNGSTLVLVHQHDESQCPLAEIIIYFKIFIDLESEIDKYIAHAE